MENVQGNKETVWSFGEQFSTLHVSDKRTPNQRKQKSGTYTKVQREMKTSHMPFGNSQMKSPLIVQNSNTRMFFQGHEKK